MCIRDSYQTHGAANNDVLRVCGKDCDGMYLPAGPLLVAAQLPDSNPVKKSALAYVETYEKANGAGSTNTFGGHMWDAGQLVVAALPVALKTGAKPGTPEFRAAMRDALESIKDLPASQGVFNMSPTDHAGFDERSRVIVKVEGLSLIHISCPRNRTAPCSIGWPRWACRSTSSTTTAPPAPRA